uniref:diphthine methyl ester synthase n=1 Tax=Aureoumbra lagunensis TaxID=44058 RepID=A0A7S3K0G1_9STRA|mmetsp:Transcript_19235/g.29172  ORF Transcript_19235/g.29172 Transcript_19235/m.29172 type:complete len:279 (+) Transcript_19235:20-856(+)
MSLFLVGLGLGDEKDITVRGLEIVKECDEVWLESYTSILGADREKLASYYGREVKEASRETVESEMEKILTKEKKIAVLVVGDPLCATTHTDLALRARSRGLHVEFIQNASVMAAVGRTGLQLYRFGQTVSIPYYDDDWRPRSFYDKIAVNAAADLHTLCLLDIKTKEPDYVELAKSGRKRFLPPRFMSITEAIDQLLECEQIEMRGITNCNTLGIGLARLGQPDQRIVAAPLSKLRSLDFGAPLHSLVICASLHELELEFLSTFYAFSPSSQLLSSQ